MILNVSPIGLRAMLVGLGVWTPECEAGKLTTLAIGAVEPDAAGKLLFTVELTENQERCLKARWPDDDLQRVFR